VSAARVAWRAGHGCPARRERRQVCWAGFPYALLGTPGRNRRVSPARLLAERCEFLSYLCTSAPGLRSDDLERVRLRVGRRLLARRNAAVSGSTRVSARVRPERNPDRDVAGRSHPHGSTRVGLTSASHLAASSTATAVQG
jgi:hypothetical protein